MGSSSSSIEMIRACKSCRVWNRVRAVLARPRTIQNLDEGAWHMRVLAWVDDALELFSLIFYFFRALLL
jgi:ureidoglycolate hydrolase